MFYEQLFVVIIHQLDHLMYRKVGIYLSERR